MSPSPLSNLFHKSANEASSAASSTKSVARDSASTYSYKPSKPSRSAKDPERRRRDAETVARLNSAVELKRDGIVSGPSTPVDRVPLARLC